MAADANLRFDRRLYDELWNRGSIAVTAELVAPDVVFDGQPLGLAGYTNWVSGFRRAFPDLQVRIERQVADEQCVVSRLAWQGTNTGEILPHLLPGWFGPAIAPTGKAVAWTSMTLHRVVDGRLVEGWLNADLVGLLPSASPDDSSGGPPESSDALVVAGFSPMLSEENSGRGAGADGEARGKARTRAYWGCWIPEVRSEVRGCRALCRLR